MLKIRRSWDRLIFKMGIPILVRRYLDIETPGCRNDIAMTLYVIMESPLYVVARSTWSCSSFIISRPYHSQHHQNVKPSSQRNFYEIMTSLPFVFHWVISVQGWFSFPVSAIVRLLNTRFLIPDFYFRFGYSQAFLVVGGVGNKKHHTERGDHVGHEHHQRWHTGWSLLLARW